MTSSNEISKKFENVSEICVTFEIYFQLLEDLQLRLNFPQLDFERHIQHDLGSLFPSNRFDDIIDAYSGARPDQ